VHVADFILDVIIKSSKETTSRVCRDFAVSDIFTLNENTIEMLAMEASSDAVVGNDDADDEERGNKTKGSGSACSSAKKCLAPMKVQIQQLLARLRKNATRHPFLIATHFIATLFTAIALGAIFYQCGRDTGGVQNRMGCCFFILLFLTLMSLSSLPVWREDDLLSRREILAGAYGVDGYFVSQIAFDVIVVRAIPPLFFSLATYFCVGLHLNFFSFVNFTFVCVLTNITASALCTCVSIATPSNASANVVGMLLLLVNVVCGGFLLNEEQPRAKAADGSGDRHILVKILTRLSFINHGFQSMMIGEFLDAGTFYFTPKLIESDPSKKSSPSSGGGDVRVPVSGKEVLDFFSFGSTRSEMRVHVVALASLACAYLAIAYFLLKFRVRY
jgi:ATP-binding cassette subfamily G (WHITE) protein 2